MQIANTQQVANILNITPRRVLYLLKQKRIQGAYKLGRIWLIPLHNGQPLVSPGKKGPSPRWKTQKPKNPTKIHVNGSVIKSNHKHQEYNAVITVKQTDSNDYGHEVEINGPCRIVYRPEEKEKLNSGARVWIETRAEVEIIELEAILRERKVKSVKTVKNVPKHWKSKGFGTQVN